MAKMFPGVYRGIVTNIIDPMQMGRLQASVPAVANGGKALWALPLTQIANSQRGVWLTPAIGGAVWIEFEQGKADYPIWSNVLPGSSTAPSARNEESIPWQYAGITIPNCAESRMRRTASLLARQRLAEGSQLSAVSRRRRFRNLAHRRTRLRSGRRRA